MLTQDKTTWLPVRTDEICADSPNAMATGPFGSAISSRFFRNKGVPVIRGSNLSSDTLVKLSDENLVFLDESLASQFRRSFVRDGDLVFTCWGTINQVGLVDADAGHKEYIVSNKQMKLSPNRSRADSLFLYYLFSSRTVQKQVEAASIGSSVPGFNLGLLRNLALLLPPLAEQRAIAEALGDVDALIAAQQKLIAKKRAIKTATMQRLLTGKQRLPGFGEGCGYKQNEIGMIPEDWTVAPLMDAVRISSGQVNPSLSHLRDLILVAPDHLESGTGRLLTKVTAAQQGAVSGKYQFFSGDVLYSKIRPYLRKVTIANFEGLCSADMYPISCEPGKILPEFLLGVLLGERFTSFAETVSARSGIPKINRDELAEFALSLPSVKEQRAIAQVLTDMDTEITALEKRLAKTKDIKQGMMQELLTGRTRLV